MWLANEALGPSVPGMARAVEAMVVNREEMEDWLDTGKAAVLKALVDEGLIDVKVANEWAKRHKILLMKKTLFKTVTNLWNKEEEFDGYYLNMVKLVERKAIKSKEEPQKEAEPATDEVNE